MKTFIITNQKGGIGGYKRLLNKECESLVKKKLKLNLQRIKKMSGQKKLKDLKLKDA